MGTARQRWASLGLRSKLLISLAVLMALATVGSMIVFVVNTNTTRASLEDQQLQLDLDRVKNALASRQNELAEATRLLASDTKLRTLIRSEDEAPGQIVLDVDRRAQPIQERYDLDLLIVTGRRGRPLANISSNGDLSDRSFDFKALLREEKSTLRLLDIEPPLLLSYSPVVGGGAVIAALALPDELRRQRGDLELRSRVDLLRDTTRLASSRDSAPATMPKARQLSAAITLGGEPLLLLASLENPQIETIVAAGRNAMLLSVFTTFILLMLIGTRFAETIIRPLARLTRVADAVAAGDWQQRAAFAFDDEIGRLGQAFDHAAATVTTLLAQRDQEASQRQSILQSITDGVLAVDADERVLLVNSTARQLLGWATSPLGVQAGTVLLDNNGTTEEGRVALAHALRAALSGEANSERNTQLAGRDVRLSCAPVRGKHGQSLGAVAVLQDITESVAADRAKTQFIATASHELRTPLAGMKGFVDLLHLQGLDNLSDDQRYALGVVRRQTDLLVMLVNDLLEVARLEQGQSAVQPTLVDATATLREVVAGSEAQLQQHQHQLGTELTEGLPALWIDSSHLRRIVGNLLSNAIKYTPDGGQIVVRVMRTGQQLRIEVEDNGVGIALRDQDKIFSRFFRSENSLSVRSGGTGLGLSLVKTMVEMHGGEVGFTSKEEQGSRFWVVFPVAESLALEVADDQPGVLRTP